MNFVFYPDLHGTLKTIEEKVGRILKKQWRVSCFKKKPWGLDLKFCLLENLL